MPHQHGKRQPPLFSNNSLTCVWAVSGASVGSGVQVAEGVTNRGRVGEGVATGNRSLVDIAVARGVVVTELTTGKLDVADTTEVGVGFANEVWQLTINVSNTASVYQLIREVIHRRFIMGPWC